MLANTQSKHHLKWILFSVATPIAVVALLFLILNIAPFGTNNLLISDLSTQYLQFFAELRRQLLNFSFSSYSFFISLGDSLIPVYTYYLLSPLNLIVIFFKPAQLPIAIDLIIWIKIVLSCISMSTFLAKKYRRYDFMTICGGLAYGLCGFVAMYFYDLMWLDALILLPLMIYGLEQLFYHNKVTLYMITLTMIIITNYYMGYIICLFCVIYMGYLIKLNQPEAVTFGKYLVVEWRRVMRFLWYSVLSGMLSAVILVPTAISMMATGKKDIHLRNFFLQGTFGPSFTVNLGIGGNNFDGRLVHNPSLFTGSLFIILGVAYFFSKHVRKRNKQAAAVLLGSILLGMWVLPLNTIWHLFQRPAGFPFRMVFLFSFALITVAYEGYLKQIYKETKVILWTSIGLGIAILMGYIWAAIFGQKLEEFKFTIPQLSVDPTIYLLVVGFLIITAIAILSMSERDTASKMTITGILIFEVCLNFFISTMGAPFVSQSRFENAYQKSETAVQRVRNLKFTQEKFYRLLIMDQPYRKIFNVPYSGYNDSLMFQNHGISSYSSTLNSKTHHVLESLGFSSRNIRRIDMLGGSVITNYLFGIKYYYLIGAHTQKLSVRPRAANLGFMTSFQIQQLKFKNSQVFTNLNQLVQAMADNRTQYVYPTKLLTSQSSLARGVYHYRFQIRARTTGPHYLYIPKVRLYHVNFWVNGEKLSPAYSGLGTEMIPIGNMSRGQLSTIRLRSTKALTNFSEMTAGVDMKQFQRVVNKADRHQFRLDQATQFNRHAAHFRGTVTVGRKQRTLLMSFPYDKGWQLHVDGKPHRLIQVADGLTGAKLPVGHHHLAFNYHIRGGLTGAIISLLGLVFMLLSRWWERWKRHDVKYLH